MNNTPLVQYSTSGAFLRYLQLLALSYIGPITTNTANCVLLITNQVYQIVIDNILQIASVHHPKAISCPVLICQYLPPHIIGKAIVYFLGLFLYGG